MNAELLPTLQATQQELDPQFKALRAATAALKQAQRLAGEEPLDALAMQKALVKLQQANEQMQNEALQTATATFAAATQTALDGLAFDFARELKATFEARGESVEGRPPTLVVNGLTLQIDIGARKAQWLYGKESLTRPIPLSINGIVKAYDQQRRAILERTVDIPAFLAELYAAWQKLTGQSNGPPTTMPTWSPPIANSPSTVNQPAFGMRPHAVPSRIMTAPTLCAISCSPMTPRPSPLMAPPTACALA
ncbi:MAG: hypothetical protein R2932_52255 [Caldilineaceae bacterium]